jgi:hypothetical protein
MTRRSDADNLTETNRAPIESLSKSIEPVPKISNERCSDHPIDRPDLVPNGTVNGLMNELMLEREFNHLICRTLTDLDAKDVREA